MWMHAHREPPREEDSSAKLSPRQLLFGERGRCGHTDFPPWDAVCLDKLPKHHRTPIEASHAFNPRGRVHLRPPLAFVCLLTPVPQNTLPLLPTHSGGGRMMRIHHCAQGGQRWENINPGEPYSATGSASYVGVHVHPNQLAPNAKEQSRGGHWWVRMTEPSSARARVRAKLT